MYKQELIEAIAESGGVSKRDAEKALNAFLKIVENELKKGEKVQITGFGTFEVVKKNPRAGRNPNTGESITIPAYVAPKFKPGKHLKDVVNE